MIVSLCDRDGSLIQSESFQVTGPTGKTYMLCRSCQEELIAWFLSGNKTPDTIQITADQLLSAKGKNVV